MSGFRWFAVLFIALAIPASIAAYHDQVTAPSDEAKLVDEIGTCVVAGRAMAPCTKYFYIEPDGTKKFSHSKLIIKR